MTMVGRFCRQIQEYVIQAVRSETSGCTSLLDSSGNDQILQRMYYEKSIQPLPAPSLELEPRMDLFPCWWLASTMY